MKRPTDTPRCSRRTALKTLAAGAMTGLAGCSSIQSADRQSSTTTSRARDDRSTVIQAVRVEGTKLSISLTDGTDVSTVTVLDPSGEQFDSKDVLAGVEKLSFDLLPAYTPGKHRVIAADDSGVLDERSVMLEPNVEILDVGVAQNHPDMEWDKSGSNWDLNAFVTIKNTGTSPQTVNNLQFSGTPQPTTKYGFDEFHIHDETQEDYTVLSGEVVTIYSITEPFQPVESTCKSAKMRVILKTSIGEDVTASYDVTMTGDSLIDNCSIIIQQGE